MKTITPTIYKRTGWHQILSVAVAAIITILAVLQLFWFEDLPNELGVLLPADMAQGSIVFAALFVICEVLAVAYFLPVALSPLARWCGRVLAWAFPLAWIGVMVQALLQQQAASTVYLGAKFDIPLSWVSVIGMVLLFVAILVVTIVDLRKS